jgi:uncharacterized phage protein (TIGR01671 family)
MREIKFKGKRVDNGEWVYGYYNYDFQYDYVTQGLDDIPPRVSYINNQPDYIEVDPETVGQYTGLKDKNGVEIYEGDEVLITNKPYKHTTNPVVVWGIKSFGWSLKCVIDTEFVKLKYYALPPSKHIEVTGNIHNK